MKSKKNAALLLTAAMLVSIVTGCSSGGDSGTSTSSGSSSSESSGTENAEKEIVEISMVHMLNPEINLKDNPVLDKIEEELGIRLIIEAPPVNDYWTRTQVIMSTGAMPDLMLEGTDVNFEKWSSEGLLADITDDIQNYPNLMKNISEQQWGDTTALHDGKIYGVPRCNSYDYWGFMINKEWLENVGMEAPTTIEEFIEVCDAFTHKDPDGNGKDDTYGVSLGTEITHLRNDFISTAYNISLHVGMPDANGEYVLNQFKSGYMDYLDTLRQMYADNILDREFITHKADENLEKFAQGRVGIVGASGKSYISELEKYDLDVTKYQYCAPLTLEEGDAPKYMMPPSNWCAFLINADTDKKDDILRLLDWANSEEGFILTHLGIQGEHYESYDLETRTLVRTPEQELAVKEVCGDMFGFANAYDGRALIEGGSTEESTALWRENVEAANQGVEYYYTPFVKVLFSMQSDFPDETEYLSNLEIRYVTGDADAEELTSYIEEYGEKVQEYSAEYAAFMEENPVQIKTEA